MNLTGLTQGDPDEVADYLMNSDDVSLSDVACALANAMRRIATLERQLETARARTEGAHAS